MRRVNVIEVLGRAQQGRTQPYLCRCDDGLSYYVKGRSAGRRGLVAEFVCAKLGAEIGLPIPEAVVADVPIELIEASGLGGPSLSDLGVGPAFGSQVVQAVEFTLTHGDLLDPVSREQVAVFDWWIRNEDRALTRFGGNVNLLWSIQPDTGLVVIDHNLAFGEFEAGRFLASHVFTDDFSRVIADFVLRDEWTQRLTEVLSKWDDLEMSPPVEWSFVDPEQTVPSNVDMGDLKAILSRCFAQDFWSVL